MAGGVTTGTGDGGETSLFSGERVPKDSALIDALGSIDELVSMLGVARNFAEGDVLQDILFVQKALFSVASEIATSSSKGKMLKKRIGKDDIKDIESRAASIERDLGTPKGFVIPAETKCAAFLDVCRAIARRCERRIVALRKEGKISNELIQVWFNRLSDYLYMLARASEGKIRMR